MDRVYGPVDLAHGEVHWSTMVASASKELARAAPGGRLWARLLAARAIRGKGSRGNPHHGVGRRWGQRDSPRRQ
jgi:hypothetical protein